MNHCIFLTLFVDPKKLNYVDFWIPFLLTFAELVTADFWKPHWKQYAEWQLSEPQNFDMTDSCYCSYTTHEQI